MLTSLPFVAALLLSTAAFAQETAIAEYAVLYPNDPIVEIDPVVVDDPIVAIDPIIDFDPIVVIDPILDEAGEVGSIEDGIVDDATYDEGIDEEWPTEGDDVIVVICDGLCIGPDCILGEEVDPSDGEEVIYTMDGVRPEDCPECRNLTMDTPVEIYQMSSGGLSVTDPDTAIAAKPRQSRVASFTPSNAAECLALYPQLPWLCEWQNNTGQ